MLAHALFWNKQLPFTHQQMDHIQKLTNSRELRIQKYHPLPYSSQENKNGYIMHVNTMHRSSSKCVLRALQTPRT